MLDSQSRVPAAVIGVIWALAPLAPAATQQPPKPDTAVTLGPMTITAEPVSEVRLQTMQRLALPAVASITAAAARQTVNLVAREDAVKYLPSVFIRKRNYGDTQST